jgi:hypothetical protein
MAKETIKERLLRQFIPPVVVGVDGSGFTVGGGGWELITAEDSEGNPTQWAVWRGYFDLSGIVEQQETLFTVNPMFQEGCDWNVSTNNPTGALQVWDMICQESITSSTFNGVVPDSGNWIPPGLMGGESSFGVIRVGDAYELEDIHYGNARSFQFAPYSPPPAQQIPFLPNQTRSSSWGVGSATAGQKLYICRAIHISSALNQESGNEIRSPPTAVVVPALIAKETDLRYIERLRRSYVVQGSVD